jgi:DNA-binding GntR family transcriptional regulator
VSRETESDRVTASADATMEIPRVSLTTEVAARLRDKIIRGEIHEGEQLRQDTVASWFGVSRIPVREALRQLQAEGLVNLVAHHGAVVAALSTDEIDELVELRCALEVAILKMAIPRMTEEHFQRAQDILDSYEKVLENEADLARWGELNWEYHDSLYSAANRPRFMSIIRAANNNVDRYVRLYLFLSHDLERLKSDHRTLLALCRKRDTAKAAEFLESHIRWGGQQLLEVIRKRRATSE